MAVKRGCGRGMPWWANLQVVVCRSKEKDRNWVRWWGGPSFLLGQAFQHIRKRTSGLHNLIHELGSSDSLRLAFRFTLCQMLTLETYA